MISVAVGAEAEQRRDVADAVQGFVAGHNHQADVVLYRRGNQSFADVIQVARNASACRAVMHQMRVQMAAIRALDGARE